MTAIITARELSKTYRVTERSGGMKAAVGSLFRRSFTDVNAVCQVSFSIEPGEVVGFIGPNGAGKTTTLKMLTGLLHPTGGEAQVAGFTPWERKTGFLRSISMVLGNKSQLMWDIPASDTFLVLAEIYAIPKNQFRQTLDELTDLLDMKDLLKRPVRNLSLGERMKCELVAGLLHRPQVLFLDEPTLGLDVSMQNQLRRFLAEYNRRLGATLLLTSHYMADVTALCPRVILIHKGNLIYDGALSGLAERLAPFKLIRLALEPGGAEIDAGSLPDDLSLVEHANSHIVLRAPRQKIAGLTAALLEQFPVSDLAVEDPPIEAVIDQIYREGQV